VVFLRLLCANPIALGVGRLCFRLPYRSAQVSLKPIAPPVGALIR
jgi:hypothetical protein